MLVHDQSKPIKAWSVQDTKPSIMDSIDNLNAEKRFLLETTGKERNSKENKYKENSTKTQEAGKVYIVPTLQMNLIGYREDEQTFSEILKRIIVADPNTRLRLATGYLNLQK